MSRRNKGDSTPLRFGRHDDLLDLGCTDMESLSLNAIGAAVLEACPVSLASWPGCCSFSIQIVA